MEYDVVKVALSLAKLCADNGIRVEDKDEEFIGTSILRVLVERRDRTDEEIETLMRQIKVSFLLTTPITDITIRYKVVDKLWV